VQEEQDAPYETILDETQAIEAGLAQVSPGGLVVIFPESVTRAINLIKARQGNS
jgi:cyanophycin synthetase